jgi:hypothetical protein
MAVTISVIDVKDHVDEKCSLCGIIIRMDVPYPRCKCNRTYHAKCLLAREGTCPFCGDTGRMADLLQAAKMSEEADRISGGN